MLNQKRVLFVCTGNTCRSPMSAGIVNFFLGETWQAFSAGVEPGTAINPNALAVMDELNIDMRSHIPREITTYQGQAFELVIVLGEYPYTQFTAWPEIGELILMPFDDPYGQSIEIYRQTRDSLQAQILPFLGDT